MSYVKTFIIPGVLLVMILVLQTITGNNQKAVEAELAAQQYEIRDTLNKIDALKSSIKDEKKVAETVVLGVDPNRKEADDKAAKTFFERIFSWDSLDSYNALRTEMQEKYKLDPKESFMDALFPEVNVATYLNPATGQIENWDPITNGKYKLSYDKIKSRVIAIGPNQYTYFAEIAIKVKTKKGATARGTVISTYKVSASGNISEMTAYFRQD